MQIGATYKNQELLGADAEPWRTEYVADRRGEARGSFVVAYGFSLRETHGRTVVVTDYDGNKVACGVLSDAERSSEEFASRQSVRGQVSLHDGGYCGEEPAASYHGKAAAGVSEGVDPWSSVKYTTDERACGGGDDDKVSPVCVCSWDLFEGLKYFWFQP